MRLAASSGARDAAADAALLLACPRCRETLQGLRCPGCRFEFPAPADIPWLFADPEAARVAWRNRYDLAARRLEAERARVLAALERTPVAATRERLRRLAAGQHAYGAQIVNLLGPQLGTSNTALESHVALRTVLPTTQGLLTYESNVFRDWCWGGVENAAALAEVRAVLSGLAPRRVLVLGAGAGRLAYDLHQATTAETTVALEINPLLACVGDRVSRGATLELTEFPLAPRCAADVAITRTLAAPAPSRPGLRWVLADALQPPFVPGSFDLVVTPWLLDILEAPVRTMLSRINQLLAPGGAWVNHGSVAFGSPDPAEQLTRDELVELAGASGFAVAGCRERELPYLCCPQSRHGRREHVLTFRADRQASCAVVPDAPRLPAWLESGTEPIPALAEFCNQALATRTHAFIMSLIDGRRSLADIAVVLARHDLMAEAEARVALQGFFTTMHQEATRGRSL